MNWLTLKFINLSKFNIALFFANIIGALLFIGFLFYPHSNEGGDNAWYWDHVFVVLWPLLAILVTVLTFVLSYYLPPILKELKDLSIGVNNSIRHKLIKNNPMSLNIFQMIMSIIVMAFLVLEIFYLSEKISNNNSQISITVLIVGYAVVTLCFWVMSIWGLALIDYDNYIHDCLLLLPIDPKNQRAYYTVIKRQLYSHLTNNDVYRFNNDLIQITKFIANDKLFQFIYCENSCIKPLFYSSNETKYLKSMTYTYDISIQRYSYSKAPTTSDDLGLPEERITTFQSFLFSSNSTLLRNFLINVVQTHAELKKTSQHEFIDYDLWVLDNLCANKDDYSFTFAFEIMKTFKSGKDARKFLLDAMKISLYRQNNGAARELYRGYLIFLAKHGVSKYISLKDNDGSTAWLFSDLIHLTMVNSVLNDSVLDSFDVMFNCFDNGIYHITNSCVKNQDIFLEWLAFIYCHNKIAKLKITEQDFILDYPKTSIFDIISTDDGELLKQVLNNNPTVIQKSDAYTLQFTRAIDDHDFWKNTKISETDYCIILHEMLNQKQS